MLSAGQILTALGTFQPLGVSDLPTGLCVIAGAPADATELPLDPSVSMGDAFSMADAPSELVEAALDEHRSGSFWPDFAARVRSQRGYIFVVGGDSNVPVPHTGMEVFPGGEKLAEVLDPVTYAEGELQEIRSTGDDAARLALLRNLADCLEIGTLICRDLGASNAWPMATGLVLNYVRLLLDEKLTGLVVRLERISVLDDAADYDVVDGKLVKRTDTGAVPLVTPNPGIIISEDLASRLAAIDEEVESDLQAIRNMGGLFVGRKQARALRALAKKVYNNSLEKNEPNETLGRYWQGKAAEVLEAAKGLDIEDDRLTRNLGVIVALVRA